MNGYRIDVPTPDISVSFSSCMVSEVFVMSMEDMDRSSLSATSEGSGFITATSESEKPETVKQCDTCW